MYDPPYYRQKLSTKVIIPENMEYTFNMYMFYVLCVLVTFVCVQEREEEREKVCYHQRSWPRSWGDRGDCMMNSWTRLSRSSR